MSTSLHGIRASAGGLRGGLCLKEDNWSAWYAKMKAGLRVNKILDLTTGTRVRPPDPPGPIRDSGGVKNQDAIDEAERLLEKYEDDFCMAASLIVQALSDEIFHIVEAVSEDPVAMWQALVDRFERVTEQAADLAEQEVLEFTHVAGETAAQTIARFESAMLGARKQGVTLSEGTQKRALLARPLEHYMPIRTEYHLARGIKPDFKWIKDSMLDFDRDFRAKRDTAGVREGAALQAAMEALWNEHQKGGGGSGRNSTPKYRKPDLGRKTDNCFCCGNPGHYANDCRFREELCRYCGKKGHLQKACLSKSRGEPAAEAEQFEDYRCMFVDAHVHIGELSRSEQELGNKEWLADSGASHHLCTDYESFSEVSRMEKAATIHQVHGTVAVHEWGTVLLACKGEGSSESIITLKDVLYVPQLRVNLFSIQKLRQAHYIPVYNERRGKIIIKERVGEGVAARLVQVATMTESNLMRPTLDCHVVMRHSLPSPLPRMHEALHSQLSMSLLHRRLGHSGQGALHRLIRERMVDGVENVVGGDFEICSPCKLGKMTRHPHPASAPDPLVQGPLDLVVMDLAGPNKQTFGKAAYNLVLVDVFSRLSWVFLLKKKSDAEEAILNWLPVAERQCGRELKILRSDGGGEFVKSTLKATLKQWGVEQQFTAPRNPESNGIAERMNRTLQEKTRTMILEMGLPHGLWGELITTACVIRNITPVSGQALTPSEMWLGKKPCISTFRVIGCKVFCLVEKSKRGGKWGAVAWEGVLVGYSANSPAYRVWDPESHKVYNIGGPDFDEGVEAGWWKLKGQQTSVEADADEDVFRDMSVLPLPLPPPPPPPPPTTPPSTGSGQRWGARGPTHRASPK